ncbi:hypothetical protein [Photobacterium salinisoli]|uniref:hypothetical protein n=1 Tax=Photobacterium salinisoli TaxID=1616783 RepID=UPI001F092EE6|nr:hypothetical protein [Photobacterium salinisoli]
MPSFVVVGYFIDRYGYSFTWSSVIVISIISAVGFYLMNNINNNQKSVIIESRESI